MKVLFYLLLVYYILDMLFPHGDISTESMRIFPQSTMALCCIYCMYINIKNSRIIQQQNLFSSYYLLVALALCYILYPFENLMLLYNNTLFFLKSYMAIIFMFSLFIYLEKDSEQTMSYIYKLYIIQLIYGFYKLYVDRTRFEILDEHELFDSNAGFMLICLLPMALTLPLKRLRLYICAAVVLGCVYSGQRSAALAAILCAPFCISYLKSSIKKIDILFFVFAFIFVISPILNDAILNIQMRNEVDMDKDSFGSGRSIFWKHVWDGFWSGNILQILFGNGTNTVPILLKRTYGMSIGAHSGWLDILYSFGIIGFFLYVKSIFILLFKNKRVNRWLPDMKNMFLILFILFFVKCSTSHGYWDITVMPFTMTLAIIAHRICVKKRA